MPSLPSAIHDLANRWQTVDPRFGRPGAPLIELDLGCGTGGFMLALARRYPERLILGAEVQFGRLRRLQNVIRQGGFRNVELMLVNNLELIGFMLPDASVRRLHLLCPDPWPKARHRAKRLATTAFFTQVARVLEPGGVLHMATDHLPYFAEVRALLLADQRFEQIEPFVPAPEEQTDFELYYTGRTEIGRCSCRKRSS